MTDCLLYKIIIIAAIELRTKCLWITMRVQLAIAELCTIIKLFCLDVKTMYVSSFSEGTLMIVKMRKQGWRWSTSEKKKTVCANYAVLLFILLIM